MPAPWQNGAAWPGSPTDGANPQRAQLDHRHLNILRSRFLTQAGNQVNVPVTATNTTLAVTFVRNEPDLSYGVQATPNWGTTTWATAKLVGGFTLNFGTAAPANATVDITVFRTES